MSFMSFDYAIRASDAALQVQSGMAQNARDTNQRASEVGKGNAQRKDSLVRDKIQAEYEMKSSEIRAKKAEQLMKLAEKKKENAALATGIVTIGGLVGRALDGAFMNNGDVPQANKLEQVGMTSKTADNGMAMATRLGADKANATQGGIVGADEKNHRINFTGVDLESGLPTKHKSMSYSALAADISASGNSRMKEFINPGPPVNFKASELSTDKDGSTKMSDGLKKALFGDGQADKGFFDTDDGKAIIGKYVDRNNGAGAAFSKVYADSAENVVNVLGNSRIKEGLGVNFDISGKAHDNFRSNGVTKSFASQAMGAGYRVLFKPIATGAKEFMQLAQVYKQYAEEVDEKKNEYEAAKKQAAAARDRLLKIDSAMAAV